MTSSSLKDKFLKEMAEADGYQDVNNYVMHQVGKKPNFYQIYAFMNDNDNAYKDRYEYVQTFLDILLELQPYSSQRHEGFLDAVKKYLPIIDENINTMDKVEDTIRDNLKNIEDAYRGRFGAVNQYERAYLDGLQTILDVVEKSKQFQMRSVYLDLKDKL